MMGGKAIGWLKEGMEGRRKEGRRDIREGESEGARGRKGGRKRDRKGDKLSRPNTIIHLEYIERV